MYSLKSLSVLAVGTALTVVVGGLLLGGCDRRRRCCQAS